MADDPLRDVYSYVERAYIRLQAGDILNRCLDEGTAVPMQQLVENLVLAGPRSLGNFREIMVETAQRKSQLKDDLNQVFLGLGKNLAGCGLQLDETLTPDALLLWQPEQFSAELQAQNIQDEKVLSTCLQLYKDSRELMTVLGNHIRLLEEIEVYLQDWLWGLAYQSARGEDKEKPDVR